MIRDLNYELGLNLDNVPFQHWTPIYLDPPERLRLKRISEEVIREFIEHVRSVIKGLSKIWWPVTYCQWWDCVKYAYRHVPSPLPLPLIPLSPQYFS